ncbi:MAG TPA: transcriptional repressor LexA [Terrimicrobiaceae bacterium]
MSALTLKQRLILEFLVSRWEAGASFPSHRDICARFGYASPKAAADHLAALKEKGYLAEVPGSGRANQLTPKALGIPILGAIPAGFPKVEEEREEEALPLNTRAYGITRRSNAFLLRVHGDSMEGRQIHDGDLVLLEKTEDVKDKDVVAALIDNESTLKTFVREASRCWLRSENPKYPEIFPAHDLQIQGVARGVIRFFPL